MRSKKKFQLIHKATGQFSIYAMQLKDISSSTLFLSVRSQILVQFVQYWTRIQKYNWKLKWNLKSSCDANVSYILCSLFDVYWEFIAISIWLVTFSCNSLLYLKFYFISDISFENKKMIFENKCNGNFTSILQKLYLNTESIK